MTTKAEGLLEAVADAIEAAWREGWEAGYQAGRTDGRWEGTQWCDADADWLKSEAFASVQIRALTAEGERG